MVFDKVCKFFLWLLIYVLAYTLTISVLCFIFPGSPAVAICVPAVVFVCFAPFSLIDWFRAWDRF